MPHPAPLGDSCPEVPVLYVRVDEGQEFIARQEENVLTPIDDVPLTQHMTEPQQGPPHRRPGKGEGLDDHVPQLDCTLGGVKGPIEAACEARVRHEGPARRSFGPLAVRRDLRNA